MQEFLPGKVEYHIFHCVCGRTSEEFKDIEKLKKWKEWHLRNDCPNWKPNE